MKIKDIVALAVIIYLLSGCDEVRTRLHMMPNQDEQECLNSERLNFKDPDVVFVANLGDRGWKLEPNTYWVRYKAKNSYGAYLQGNMLCKQSDKKWVRDTTTEYLIALSISTSLLEEELGMMKSNPNYQRRFKGTTAEDGANVAYKFAIEVMNESPGSIANYAKEAHRDVDKH